MAIPLSSPLADYRSGSSGRGLIVAPQPSRRRRRPPARQLGSSSSPGGYTDWRAIVAENQAIERAEEEEERGWRDSFGSGLGVLINNPITRNVINPAATVISAPLRAVAATIDEAAEELTGNEDDQSWWDNFTDETYGMGDVIPDTGNQWADRFIGFGADVVVDPLTYVGGLGIAAKTGAAAGRGARAANAIKALQAGVDPEDIAIATRLNYGAATPDVRRAMGVNEGGARLIGGEATIGSRPGLAWNRARGAAASRFNDTAAGRALIRSRAPRGLEDAYETLFAGARSGGSPLDVRTAINEIAQSNWYRQGQGGMAGRFGRDVNRINRLSRKAGAAGRRRALDRLEGVGNVSQGNQLSDEMGDLLNRIRVQAVEEGVHIEEASDYVPHILTERAREGVQRASNQGVEAPPLVIHNDMNPSGVTMHRELRPGAKLTVQDGRTGKVTEITVGDDASITGINRLGREKGLDYDIYETDPGTIMEKYLNMVSGDVGTAVAAREGAASGLGQVRRAPTDAEGRTLPIYDQMRSPQAASPEGREIPTALGTDEQIFDRLGVPDVDREVLATRQLDDQTLSLQGRLGDEMGPAVSGTVEEAVAAQTATYNRLLGRQKDATKRLNALKREFGVDDARVRAALIDRDAARAEANEAARKLRELNRTVDQLRGRGDLDSAAQFQDMADDIRRILDEDPMLAQPENAAAVTQLNLAAEMSELAGRSANDVIPDLDPSKVGRVVNVTLADEWEAMAPAVLQDDFIIAASLKQSMDNLTDMSTSSAFWRLMDKYTALFKTYATLSPGFNVRNAMSAVFLNTSDGIPLRTQFRGRKLAAQFASEQKKGTADVWLSNQSEEVQRAFAAAFGSGIGGRYAERGVAGAGISAGAMFDRAINNPATRGVRIPGTPVGIGQSTGSFVEGAVRLPVALDTLGKGGTVQDALTRITRLHFDYSQASRMDEYARRIFPFWTFMSRNLPLMVAQMWTRPRTFSHYNSFVRNMRVESPEGEPEYFSAIGAFPVGSIGGQPFYLQPDLQHVRISEDLDRYAAALSGDPAQALSDVGPNFSAPVEFITRKDLFTGREFGPDDYSEAWAPVTMLAFLLGQTEQTPGGKTVVSDNFINALRATIPVYDRAIRLTGDNGRPVESWARFMGAPVRTLTPEQQQSTLASEYYDNLDEYRLQQALAELDQGG